MSKLTDLPNIGKVLERNLNQIGVTTPEQLAELGSKDAFLRIRLHDSGACLRVLYALEGAIQGILDTRLEDATKQDLRQFYKLL